MSKLGGLTAALVIGAGVTGGVAAADVPDGPELVSVQRDGSGQGNVRGSQPLVSDNGNRVVFHAGVYGESDDGIYLRNRAAGTTSKVVSSSPEVEKSAEDLSGNGRYVAVRQYVDAVNEHHQTVNDLVDGSSEPVSNAQSFDASLSDSGRIVAFVQHASGVASVFVKNLDTGKTTRVSSSAAPASDPVISGDGRKVGYRQYGHVYAKTLATGTLSRVDVKPDGTFGPRGDATPVAFSDAAGFLLFTASATNLASGTAVCDNYVDMTCAFRRNFAEAKTTTASVIDGRVTPVHPEVDLSGDGRVVTFAGGPQILDAVFARVLSTATTREASVNADGDPADASAGAPTLNFDGTLVAFTSSASNFGRPVDGSQVWIARGK